MQNESAIVVLYSREHVLNLKPGDIVLIPEFPNSIFIVNSEEWYKDGAISLIVDAVDNNSTEIRRKKYPRQVSYLRDKEFAAVFTKEDLWELLKSGSLRIA